MTKQKAYFADATKHRLHTQNPLRYDRVDKNAGQTVRVIESVFGVAVQAPKIWSPLCQKLFTTEKANGISLGSILFPWSGNVAFINGIPQCKNLTVKYANPVDFSVLAGNTNIEGLELDFQDPAKTPEEFDLSSLPNLQRCWVMSHPAFASVSKCKKLVSLWLQGGKHEGVLTLEQLPTLEEFICREVRKIKGVVFNPKVRLRSLDLTNMRLLENVGPLESITEKLLVVRLQAIPRMNIEWLAQAKNLESIGLGVGKISTINFLKGLKHLQVISLWGSKVLDQDFSIRDSLKGELDSKLWGRR